MKPSVRRWAIALIAFSLASGPISASAQNNAAQNNKVNDYPTAAIADYVFGCMASNGQSRQVLERCACSIDVIASILDYESYVEAETVMSLRLVGGEKGSLFRVDPAMRETVANLKRSQAEAEIRCF